MAVAGGVGVGVRLEVRQGVAAGEGLVVEQRAVVVPAVVELGGSVAAVVGAGIGLVDHLPPVVDGPLRRGVPRQGGAGVLVCALESEPAHPSCLLQGGADGGFPADGGLGRPVGLGQGGVHAPCGLEGGLAHPAGPPPRGFEEAIRLLCCSPVVIHGLGVSSKSRVG